MAKFLQFSGSPDVFEKETGLRLTPEQAKERGAFRDLDVIATPRPAVKQESQFQAFAEKPLSQEELSSVQQATGVPKTTGVAGTTGEMDRSSALNLFNTTLVDIFKQFQGLDRVGLQKKKEDLQRQQLGAISETTPEELRGLSPSQQSSIRQGEAGALEPGIQSIGQLQQSMSQFNDLLNTARQFGADFAANMPIPENVVQGYVSGIESGELSISDVPTEVRNRVAAGVDFSKIPSDVSTMRIERGGRQILVNSKTGEDIKDLGVANTEISSVRASASGAGGKLSVAAQAVYDNPALLRGYTPTRKGQILDELARAGKDLDRFATTDLSVAQRDQLSLFDEIENEANFIADLATKVDLGPVASRAGSLASVFGMASQEFVNIKSSINNMSSILLRMRSGAAVTPQEYERIRGFIPEMNEDETTVQQKMTRFYDAISAAKANYIKRSTQSTFDIIQEPQSGFGKNLPNDTNNDYNNYLNAIK